MLTPLNDGIPGNCYRLITAFTVVTLSLMIKATARTIILSLASPSKVLA